MVGQDDSAPLLSVIIKALNEEKNIEACISSTIAATAGWKTEIIVADSHSEDRTVELASRFPVTVVRLVKAEDRCCGAGGQLGYQFAHGRFILILDGDMELVPGFLEEAIALLEADPRIAGVGGALVEKSCAIEFVQRSARNDVSQRLGKVPHLNSGGLYRMEAIREIGYFTNRNLHSREEFELGARLRTAGWKLMRIGAVAITHYGHSISSWKLLGIRWRSKYFHGYGELLRSAFGKPHFYFAMQTSWLFFLVVFWWLALLVAGVLSVGAGMPYFAAFLGLLLFPFVALLLRKQDVMVASYTMALWNVIAAALVAGLFHKQVDPCAPLDADIVQP